MHSVKYQAHHPLWNLLLRVCTHYVGILGELNSLSHVRRQGNGPTHLLAKHAKSIVDFTTWIEENPYFIEQIFIQDVIAFSHT